MLKVPCAVRSVRAAQSASCRVTLRAPAARSNQYQPPSMNCLSGSRTSISSVPSPLMWRSSTGWLLPLAVERYTITVQSPLMRSRSTTSSRTDQRFQ